jgi:hypothetical protein
LRASISDTITGTVEIVIGPENWADAEPSALKNIVLTWVDAVQMEFFGPGEIRLQESVETHGENVSLKLVCQRASLAAFRVLLIMVRHLSKVSGRDLNISLFLEGRRLQAGEDVVRISLPPSIPFAIEYPNDLHAAVRVEIEFRAPLTEKDQEAIFRALATWDALIAALGNEERWGERVDNYTQLLSPTIVEHEVVGYFASFECLQFIILIGLYFHRRLSIERITIES